MGKSRINEKAIEAMKLLVQWYDMREFCENRTHCCSYVDARATYPKCAYWDIKNRICGKYSTETVLIHCANAFQSFLLEKGII